MTKRRIYTAVIFTFILVALLVIFFQYGSRTKDVFDGVLVEKEAIVNFFDPPMCV